MGNVDGAAQGFGNQNDDDLLGGLAESLNALNSFNQNLRINMTEEQKQLSDQITSTMLGGIFNPSLNNNLLNISNATQKEKADKYKKTNTSNYNMEKIDNCFVESASKKKLLIFGYFHLALNDFNNKSIDSVHDILMKYILYFKDGKLIINENEKYELESNDINHPYEFEEILIKHKGILTTNPTGNKKKGGMLFMKCMENVTLNKNAQINLNGKGWSGGYGNVSGGGFYEETGGGKVNGLGPGGGKSSGGSNNHCSAAGNGSYGSSNYSPSSKHKTFARDLSGAIYGDNLLTTMYRGSGGATANRYSGHAGNGGGSLWLYCWNNIIINSNMEPAISCDGTVRDKFDGGGSGGSIYLECNEVIYKPGILDSLGIETMIISAIGGLSKYEYREEEYLTISKCGGDGRIRIKQNKYKQGEFINVSDIFQKRIYPKPYWGEKFTQYDEKKIYEEVVVDYEMDRIHDRVLKYEREKERYNTDIINE